MLIESTEKCTAWYCLRECESLYCVSDCAFMLEFVVYWLLLVFLIVLAAVVLTVNRWSLDGSDAVISVS